MLDVITLAVAEKYTRDSLVGLGALKGAPCTISKTETVSDGTERCRSDDDGYADALLMATYAKRKF